MKRAAKRNLGETLREEMRLRDAVLRGLDDGPLTVPELAEALGRPAYEVLYWVMGLRRYGLVSETEQVTEAGYYKYERVAGEAP
jgi:hypothetical protein